MVGDRSHQTFWDFPGGSVINTLPSNAGSMGSSPGGETKVPYALWCDYNFFLKSEILGNSCLMSLLQWIYSGEHSWGMQRPSHFSTFL